jgi:hypothetical protein
VTAEHAPPELEVRPQGLAEERAHRPDELVGLAQRDPPPARAGQHPEARPGREDAPRRAAIDDPAEVLGGDRVGEVLGEGVEVARAARAAPS